MKDMVSQGVLFMGRPGLPLREEAKQLAADLLACDPDRLEFHPSYLLVETSKGKKTMGVEEAELVVSTATQTPVLSDRRVIIIDGIDRMTEAGQNKLLKTLEDKQDAVILATAYSDTVLSTIKSRMSIRERLSLSYEAFLAALPEEYKDDAEHYYRITSGCPGLVDELSGYSDDLKVAYQDVRSGDLVKIVADFHLVREKDKAAITASPYMLQAMQAIEAALMAELENNSGVYTLSELGQMVGLVIDNKARLATTAYTKDDFFRMVMELIEIKED